MRGGKPGLFPAFNLPKGIIFDFNGCFITSILRIIILGTTGTTEDERGCRSTPYSDSSRRIPKYANVPSKLHTGAKVEPKKLMSTRQVAQRHDEIFKRVKPSTLACWIQENEVTESVFGLVDDDKNWEARSDA